MNGPQWKFDSNPVDSNKAQIIKPGYRIKPVDAKMIEPQWRFDLDPVDANKGRIIKPGWRFNYDLLYAKPK